MQESKCQNPHMKIQNSKKKKKKNCTESCEKVTLKKELDLSFSIVCELLEPYISPKFHGKVCYFGCF